MVVSNGPQRDVFVQKATVFSAQDHGYVMTMVSNLGDLLSYGYLGIVELPTHSNLCPSRMISVHNCYLFSVLINKYPDSYVPFRHFPDVGEKI